MAVGLSCSNPRCILAVSGIYSAWTFLSWSRMPNPYLPCPQILLTSAYSFPTIFHLSFDNLIVCWSATLGLEWERKRVCSLEPEFYGNLVYKFKKITGRTDFSDQFRNIILRHKRIGYDLNVMRQSAC